MAANSPGIDRHARSAMGWGGRILCLCRSHLLVSATVAFLLGAMAAYYLAPEFSGLSLPFFILPLLALCALLTWRLPRLLQALGILPFCFCTGLFHTHMALQAPPDPWHISHLVTDETKATLIGRVQSMVEFDGEKSRFLLESEEALPHGRGLSAPMPVRGLIQVSIKGAPMPFLRPGRTVMLLARVAPVSSQRNPGTFNLALRQAARDILVSAWVRSSREILPLEDAPQALWQELRFLPEQARQRSAAFLERHLPRETAGVYEALLIGSWVNIPPKIREAFRASGCLHILAISGLHLTLLSLVSVLFWSLLLKRSRILLLHCHVPGLALLLTAPLLIGYSFLAGMNIPALRALFTALLVLAAFMLRSARSLLPLVSAAALLVLALHPLALFTASFQLSFAAVLAILCIAPRLVREVEKRGKGHGIASILRTRGRWLLAMLAVSVAAALGTLPFLLLHFNNVSLIGPVMNLLIEPLLCFWALPCGLLALPLSFAWPDAAVRLLDFGAIAIHLSLRITAEAARFPWASVWTITPEGKEIFLYFLTLFLLFRPGIRLRQRSIALLPAALLILSFTRTLWLPERDHGLHAHILDVGQGNAVVLQVPGGGTTLIDGGGRESPSFNPGRNIIAPFLWHLRRWRVDDIIITHPHQDHYNGLAFILEHFHPQRLIINNDPGEETAYQELLNQARRHGVTMQYARAGDRLFSGREFSLDCLGMPGLIPADEEKSWSVNDRSLVLRARYGGLSLLFPGDIGRRSEALLVSSGKATPCDLLLAPHHGSRASLSPAFLRALSPALMVVSSGKSSTGVLPAPEHLRHWRQQSIPFLLTTEEGAVTISMQDGGISVSTSARKKHPASGTGKPASPAWLARPGTGHDNAPFIREPGTTAR